MTHHTGIDVAVALSCAAPSIGIGFAIFHPCGVFNL
jgi:hypothetical protein